MKEFDYSALKNKTWDAKIIGYLTQIHEAKARQEIFLEREPKSVEKLIEIAKIQSTEYSNEIEGIRTTSTRLKQLFNEKTTPRNRDEEEIAGYRDALNVIHENYNAIQINPNYILQLHKILLSHTSLSFGGKFKNVQNYISATDGNGQSYTIFTPLTPVETPIAIEKICSEYNHTLSEGIVNPLILIPIFIQDFLCIHPFLDGNGRMSRLLTTLLLYRSGYHIAKYISLEAKIAKNKDLYYDALYQPQSEWHENSNDSTPFIKYFLSIILNAYNDFEEKAKLTATSKNSIEIVQKAVQSIIGKFNKQDIISLTPSISSTSIERALKALCTAGQIKKEGSGKSTYYVRLK